MRKIFCNERGFMLMSTIFVMMITAFMAMMILNGTKKVSNQKSALKIIAVNLADEQFAYIESDFAQGKIPASNFLGDAEDLKNFYDNGNKENIPVEFQVITNISGGENNLYTVKVKVTWNFDNIDNEVEFEKVIRKIAQ